MKTKLRPPLLARMPKICFFLILSISLTISFLGLPLGLLLVVIGSSWVFMLGMYILLPLSYLFELVSYVLTFFFIKKISRYERHPILFGLLWNSVILIIIPALKNIEIIKHWGLDRLFDGVSALVPFVCISMITYLIYYSDHSDTDTSHDAPTQIRMISEVLFAGALLLLPALLFSFSSARISQISVLQQRSIFELPARMWRYYLIASGIYGYKKSKMLGKISSTICKIHIVGSILSVTAFYGVYRLILWIKSPLSVPTIPVLALMVLALISIALFFLGSVIGTRIKKKKKDPEPMIEQESE